MGGGMTRGAASRGRGDGRHGGRVGPAWGQVHDAARAALAQAATAFLAALPEDGRRRATFAFDHRERLNWATCPGPARGCRSRPCRLAGRAHELLKASLSVDGDAKAVNVIRLEGVLRQLETFGGLMRDPENYAVMVFGTPGRALGYRLEGHHLSLNFTLVPGRPVAVTPAFLGANPAEVPSGPLKGLRALAASRTWPRAARSMDARSASA